MNQNLLSEIKEIASDIVTSNSIDTKAAKEKVLNLYNKLSILEYLEKNIEAISNGDEISNDNTEPVIEENAEPIGFSIDREGLIEDLPEEKEKIAKKEEVQEDVQEEVQEEIVSEIKEETTTEPTIEKVVNKSNSTHKSSLHEELKKSTIQIGLNDRIAFVKRLFDGNQQDFHRVLSQVNTFSNIDEVKEFIDTMVKPEHNWDNHEEYAERFMDIIEAKFQK